MKSLEEAPVEIINLDREKGELYHQEFIVFRDTHGNARQGEHPVVVGDLTNDQPDQILKIGFSGNIEEMSFEDYLYMMDIKYVDYIKSLKAPHNDGIDPCELIKAMHQSVIAERTRQALKMEKKSQGNENQEQTAKDHSQFFIRLINELGIDGLDATEALPREDFLDEIDEFLVFDKKAYETDGDKEGQKIYIGVQRSFKHKSLTSDTVLIPEETEKGLVVKVFIKEEIEDYEDADRVTWFQRLLELRTAKAKEKGMSPAGYAKENPKTDGIPPIAEVLPGGQTEQVKRVVKILREIESQFRVTLSSEEEIGNLSPYWKKKLVSNFHNLPIQKIIDELSGN